MMDKSLELLDQIKAMAEWQEKELKEFNLSRHKAARTVGEGALLFHLKILKDLMLNEAQGLEPASKSMYSPNYIATTCGLPPGAFSRWSSNIQTGIVLDDKSYTIAYGVDNGWTGSPETHPGIPCIVVQPPVSHGCIDKKYCYNCKTIVWSSICVCALWSCDKCGGTLSVQPPADTADWTKLRR